MSAAGGLGQVEAIAPARTGSERGELLSEVCNAIVHIHKRFYGKGPTKARAHLTHDLLTVVLEGGFTRGEETLTQSGHESEVLRSRIVMQHSVEQVFLDAIEGIIGRPVRSFMSANDPSSGLQVEVFVFDSQRGSGRSADGDGDGNGRPALDGEPLSDA